jgi:hypothetical protein
LVRVCCKDEKERSDDRQDPIVTVHVAAFVDGLTFKEEDGTASEHAHDEYLDQLAGLSTGDLDLGKPCVTEWLDVDTANPRGLGPLGAVKLAGWISLSVNGGTTTGRYLMDVWNDYEPGTGPAGYLTAYAVAGNIRLIERLPPPKPGPPGWTAIAPGQCVRGNVKADASPVVGRYWIRLPARRMVAVDVGKEWEHPCLREVLEFEGQRLRCEGERFRCQVRQSCRYRIPRDGDYQLTLYRESPSESGELDTDDSGPFLLQVAWGEKVF